MPLAISLVTGVTATGGPFPPDYPAGANGYTNALSNPGGYSAGSINASTYFGANILAIVNDAASNPTQLLVAMEGTQDQSFIGSVTTPDGKVYEPTATSVFETTLVGSNTVTIWIWLLQSGASALANGTVTIGDTGDDLVNITGSSPSSTEIDLVWTNSGPTPSSYDLYRSLGDGVTPTLYQTLSGTTLTYSDTNLTANTQYNYYVVAVNSDGTTASSELIEVWTSAAGVSDTFNCDCDTLTPDGWTVDTLANLRQRFLIRCGYATQAANPPPGMKLLANEMLQDAQKQLYRQHKEFRQVRMYAWQMEINQRYYGLNADESGCNRLDPLSVEWVGFEDLNQAWYKLIAGIDPLLYTRAQISTGWPTHYEIRQCIEIFPAPKSPYTLWIKGRFGLNSFVNDTDLTTIDAEAIYLLACGMYKTSVGQADAGALMTQALNYTKYLVSGQHLTKRYVPRTRPETPLTPPVFLPIAGEG